MKHIYVAQTASGLDTGDDVANAHSLAWLNTAGNWGSGTGQISPGDVVHLCGQFTGPAVFQASGIPGNLTKFLFETGTKFSAAHWNQGGANGNAAIYANGKSYIEVDGGTDGVIEATANGTARANQLDCHGVRFDGPLTGVSVHNLVVRDLYVRTADSADANYVCNGVYIFNSQLTDVRVYSVTTSNAGTGIQVSMGDGSSLIKVYSNTCSQHGIAVNMGTTANNVLVDDVQVFNNDLSGDLTWSGESTIHQNTFHIFATQAGALITNLRVYGNYFHGNMGSFPTSLAFLEGYIAAPQVYNNVFFHDTFSGGNGDLVLKGANGAFISNNTFTNNTSGGNTAIGSSEWTGTDTFSAYNNVILDYNYAIYDGTTGGAACAAATNNLIYPDTQQFRYGGAIHTYAEWVASGKNAGGVTVNPALDATYKPAATSSVVDAGADLSAYFTTDKAGVTRTVWDIGAYEYIAAKIVKAQRRLVGNLVVR